MNDVLNLTTTHGTCHQIDDTAPNQSDGASVPKEPANGVETASKLGIACYVRVSSDGQTHDAQRHEITAWLAKHGVDPDRVSWYCDTITGAHHDRPSLNALCEAIELRTVHTVIVQRIDRVSRSERIYESLGIIGRWADRGVRLVSLYESIDLSGPIGQALAALLLALAATERQKIRERQRAGIDAAKARDRALPPERRAYRGSRHGLEQRRARQAGYRARACVLRSQGCTTADIAKVLEVSRRYVQWLLNGSRPRAGKSKEPQNLDPPGDQPAT